MADVNNMPGNSINPRKPVPEENKRPTLERVTASAPIEKKPGLGSRIRESFTGDDAQSVGSYVLFDVVIPAAKALFLDVVNQGLERKFYGTSSPISRGVAQKIGGYTSYNTRSYPGKPDPTPARREVSQRSRETHDFREIFFATRGEAEEVIARLQEMIASYDFATVKDFYDLAGVTSEFTDETWGWDDLRTVSILRPRQGILINFPPTKPIDR